VIRLLLLLMALVAAPAHAQPSSPVPGSGEILRGTFVQERHLQGFKAPIRSDGTFTLAIGRGLIWHVERPFQVTTVITPGALVQYSSGAETLRLPTSRIPALGRLYDMLGSALAADWRALEDEFTVSRQQEGGTQVVTLVPRGGIDSAAPVKSITARTAHFIEQVEIERPSGDRDRLLFTDQSLSGGGLREREAELFTQAPR
jgi:hypothetical protein